MKEAVSRGLRSPPGAQHLVDGISNLYIDG